MSLLYRTILRPALFLQDSEKAHSRLISSLSVTSRSRLLMSLTGNLYGSPELPVKLFGLDFPNPLGIAAGIDKNGEAPFQLGNLLDLVFQRLGVLHFMIS